MQPLTRRTLLAALLAAILLLPAWTVRAQSPIVIEDSRGPQSFATSPKRVIALNWALAEMLIDLGVTPAGIADIEGYDAWVVDPPVPAGVADVGKRGTPNLERILSLQPDLILLGGQQEGFVPHLAPIMPLLHYELYSEDHDNAAAVRNAFLDLGRLFGKSDAAEAKLAAMDARLAELKAKIASAYPGGAPKVTIVRFIDDKRVVISGKNGLPEAALTALGLKTGLPVENSRWGIAFKPVTALADIKEGFVMHVEPFEKGEQLFSTTLWQEMPFVKADRFRTLPPLWTYGGALSIGRIGEEIAKVLLAGKS